MLFLISLSPSLYWFLFSSSKCNQLSSSSSFRPRSFFPFLGSLTSCSSPLSGVWHTIDYCSRKTFDLNGFLSVSVKRKFTMGVLYFCTSYEQRHELPLLWTLSKVVCITNMKVRDCVSLKSEGQLCLLLILIKIAAPSGAKIRQVYCSL